MTLDELKSYLRSSGISFAVEVEDIPPSNLWTEQEQIDDCCEIQSDFDECIEVGKTEPWSGWTDDQRNELGIEPPSPTPEELLDRAEDVYGKGNVHLQIVTIGPVGNCGEMETTWTGELGCCEDPPELLKVSGSSSVTIDNDYTYVVRGGESPASWAVQGTGLSVSGDGYTGRVHVDECFCTPGIVYATDSCLSVAPWVLSRSDGSWESIDDEVLSSPWGWLQDGSSSSFYLSGFNGDFTKVSTHHYSSGRFTGAPETVCPGAYEGIDTDTPIVTPGDTGLYEKCPDTNVWWKLVEGHANTYDVIWSVGSGGTVEYTNSCQDNDLEYDEDSSGDVLADNSHVGIVWTGGTPPFTVSVDGVEVYLDVSKTKTEISSYNNRSISVYSSNSCGTSSITITDRCGSSVDGAFRSTNGSWVRRYSNTQSGGVQGVHYEGVTTKAPYANGCPVQIVLADDASIPYYGTTYYQGGWSVGVRSNVRSSCPGDHYGRNTECYEGGYCANPTKEQAYAKTVSNSYNTCVGCQDNYDINSRVINDFAFTDPHAACVGTVSGWSIEGCHSIDESRWENTSTVISHAGPEDAFHSRLFNDSTPQKYLHAHYAWRTNTLVLEEWVC